jgi:hypothetical protein
MNTRQRYLLPLEHYLPIEYALDVSEAQSSAHTVHIRVDWNGDSGGLGTFEVQDLDGRWEACSSLSPDCSANDLILAGLGHRSDPFVVHIKRGPDHGACPFEAWALPITWKLDPLAHGDLPKGFSVVRRHHYDYVQTHFTVHAASAPEHGLHAVRLELDARHDYELWVKLRHPAAENRWCIQDPVIRSGDRGSSRIPRVSPDESPRGRQDAGT